MSYPLAIMECMAQEAETTENWPCAQTWDEGLLEPAGGSRYQQSSGFEVGGVGEAVGGASQDLEQVDGALDSAVGGPVAVVPGEDLV